MHNNCCYWPLCQSDNAQWWTVHIEYTNDVRGRKMRWHDRKQTCSDQHHQDNFPVSSFNTSCVPSHPIKRLPVASNHLTFNTLIGAPAFHILNVENTTVKQRISYPSRPSLSAVFNWHQYKYPFDSWINSMSPSFHSSLNRMFVCSQDVFSPLDHVGSTLLGSK